MAKQRAAKIEAYEEVEVSDEPVAGGGLEFGLIMATFLTLLVGSVAGLLELGNHYGIGPFK